MSKLSNGSGQMSVGTIDEVGDWGVDPSLWLSSATIGGAIGTWCGGRGVVFAASHPSHPRPLALKRVHADDRLAALVHGEVITARHLRHRNVLPYLEAFVSGSHLYVLTPLMTLGSFRDLLDGPYPRGIPERACAIALRDTLRALEYLHAKGYVHRGVRASRLLACPHMGVRLGGLRSAAPLLVAGERRKRLHALPPYAHDDASLLRLGPEVLQQNLRGYDEKSDVYSVGVLACELANGAVPFSDVPLTLMLTEKVRGNAPQLLDRATFRGLPEVQRNFDGSEIYESESEEGAPTEESRRIAEIYATRRLSDEFHEFTYLCLQRDPTVRLSCTQQLNHPFFKQISKTDCLVQILSDAKPLQESKESFSAILLEDRLREMDVGPICEWDF